MAGSDYNFTSRLLHRLALQLPAIAEMAFDADGMIATDKDRPLDENPVFVTGLARSGTTMLMRYLYESGEFRSLTYMDMPFVLMPNLWKKLSPKRSGELRERSHKDGIMVSFESPEAFEEVFWRVFTGKKYIGKDRLEISKISSDVLDKFRRYIHHILLSADEPGQQRYLSKNNNNILRLSYLRKIFPQASIIIPFRDPLQHALSLLSQHLHFSEVQSADKFTLDYMTWLGHYEFGLNQKPFYFGEGGAFTRLGNYEKTDLNFWLLSWKNYYEYAIRQGEEINALFFCYEDFCRSPSVVLNRLFDILGVKHKPSALESFTPFAKKDFSYDTAILEECNSLYEKLSGKFHTWYIRH